MSAAPLLPILEAFRTSLSGLPTQPTWREAAIPGAQDVLPSIALQLGSERYDSGKHGVGTIEQVRTVRLSVIVADDSQIGAEQCAWEVQEAVPYVATDTEWDSNERAEHSDAERHYFTVRVNFDVKLDISIPI